MKIPNLKLLKPIKSEAVFVEWGAFLAYLIRLFLIGQKKAMNAPDIVETLSEPIENEVLELDELWSFVY